MVRDESSNQPSSTSATAESTSPTSAGFFRIDELVAKLWEQLGSIEGTDTTSTDTEMKWPRSRRVNYEYFSLHIWPKIQAQGKPPSKVPPLVVWTQIQSHLKGSVEAVMSGGSGLSLDQYLNTSDFNEKRCRMEESSRHEVHSLYLRYQSFLSSNGYWDDGDMTAAVVTALRSVQQTWEGPLYDRVYVDEVQDLTQAEIAVLILASGCRCESVFFAGDTAQSITPGVEFRFEEVSYDDEEYYICML